MQIQNTKNKLISVVVVGQTPPPFHGQAVMIQMLLDGPIEGVQFHHVRMAFSNNMDQVGRFQLRKLMHLIAVIFRIGTARITHNAKILYYPPAGPNRVPVFRDIVLLICTRWMFRRTVFHFHASGVSELIAKFRPPLRALAWCALGRPDAAIQMSNLIGQDAVWLKARKVYVIPNAVLDEATRLEWNPLDRLISSTKKILYVGTVCESKGILILLNACTQLRQAGVAFHLDVVGSYQPSEFSTEVQKIVREFELEEHVTLHGQKTGDCKWRMFSNANVFCFPSHYASEGFPCVLLEAMCFALPVISTRWRGIPSIVEHGSTGYLIDVQDAEELYVAMQKLFSDSKLMHAMGIAGRTKFLAQYSNEQHLQQMRQVFVDMAQSNPT